jgi:transcriptional regulator with XRE-family HTH domain
MAKIKRLASKAYRDAYLAARVRATIAIQVRALRHSLSLSQKQFAQLIGTTQSAVSDLENPDGDQVSVQTLLNIAAALNVALIVRFAGFPDFLKLMSNMSPEGLRAETIDETIARSKARFASGPIDTVLIRVPASGTDIVEIGVPATWPQTSPMSPLLSGQVTQNARALPSIATSTPTSAKDNWGPSTSP